MIAVRLSDGTTVYGFGGFSVTARNAVGLPDPLWQRAAEDAVAGAGGDLLDGLLSLPGATLVHEGAVSIGAVSRSTAPSRNRLGADAGRGPTPDG